MWVMLIFAFCIPSAPIAAERDSLLYSDFFDTDDNSPFRNTTGVVDKALPLADSRQSDWQRLRFLHAVGACPLPELASMFL